MVDSGAGFFIEEDPDDIFDDDLPVSELPPPIIKPDQPNCEECKADFSESFLFRTFDVMVCDKCKDTERDGKHELITKVNIVIN